MSADFIQSGNISFILVFLEGVLSFFSPCVIPLLPVYMSYLAGNTNGEEGDSYSYHRKKVFLHTLMFVIGISFAFFILGMTFTSLGRFFHANRNLFIRIGGIIIVILGLFQLGIFELKFLQRERKFYLNLNKIKVNPFTALVLGFTFSFAWTPCIGPALSSVLILASGAKNAALGNWLVLVYTLGFVIPFLVLGIFTTKVLSFFNKNKKLLKYTIKAGGVLLIIIGIMTFTGWMNGITSYLNSFGGVISESTGDEDGTLTDEKREDKEEAKNEEVSTQEMDNEEAIDNTENNTGENTGVSEEDKDGDREIIPAFDFTLTDQYGNTHILSDYKGKVVFLNFWATWCPPCREEMPHIEELYEEYGLNEEEVVFLGVANPKSSEYPTNQDESKEDVIAFLEENGYTFPTVFDETGEIFYQYAISSFPTTFMIDKEGNFYGYIAGKLTKDIMVSIIEETKESTE